jgi:hypothetical protein
LAELIERLLEEVEGKAKIPLHAFQATLAEWARGKLTGAQALDQLEALAPPRLNAAEQAEAQAIVNLVTSIPISGTAAAIADGKASRALKIKEIDDVFLLMDNHAPAYDSAAEVRSKLGI